MNNLKIKFDEIIRVNTLKKESGIIKLCDNDIYKKNIIRRLDLLSLNIFTLEIKYKKINSSDIVANYELYVEGEQKCVISLKPVKFIVREKFNINFCDHKKLELSVLEDEFIEPIYNGEINFSEIAVQMLLSFLDPYPKINNGDINLENVYEEKLSSNKSKNNPFEVLNNLNK
ncbi:MAG: hypothetical protein CMJ12_02355 [Pelagibacterales bacterium]|nr:hypothetical protein [Pelagibacterales bacterium]PPR15255.1 MAG: hypothetical protein CFH33_01551 [Alphaproteobacteria bacterium MarineAlpha9_Bin3]|tara:strand:+ start:14865 stop:15383 length:519 start_codon:yes stop_codon:yes gene_type:complete